MKKIFNYLLISIITLLVSITSVSAADYFKMDGCPSGTGTFTLKISGSYSGGNIDVKVTTNGSITRLNGNSTFTLTDSKKEVSIDFNATGNGTVTAEITNGVAISTKTRTCKIGNNTTKSTQKTTKKTTKKTTTTSTKSNNNNLKSLTVKNQDGVVLTYTPEFKSDVYEYVVEADATVNKVSIVPSVEDAKANVVFEPSNYNELTIKDGDTTKISIVVTAEDGTSKKTYNVNVKKASLNSDATLKSLTIKEVPDFKFVSTQNSYDIPLSGNFKTLDIKCVPNNEKAKCVITNNENLKNGSTIRVVVTSENNTTKVYTLNIIKKVATTKAQVKTGSDKDPLVIIILSVLAVFLLSAIVGVLKK